jgi:hypothetical protein
MPNNSKPSPGGPGGGPGAICNLGVNLKEPSQRPMEEFEDMPAT